MSSASFITSLNCLTNDLDDGGKKVLKCFLSDDEGALLHASRKIVHTTSSLLSASMYWAMTPKALREENYTYFVGAQIGNWDT